MNQLYLLLGGNLGDRFAIFTQARKYVEKRVGTLLLQSKYYESAPWGFTHENLFLNQVLIVSTSYCPEEVLEKVLDIEKELGRERSSSAEYSSRMIDIDLLFYNDLILDQPDLKIPHPLLHKRRFTLKPLVEVAPDFVHPVFFKTIRQLLADCEDDIDARPISVDNY